MQRRAAAATIVKSSVLSKFPNRVSRCRAGKRSTAAAAAAAAAVQPPQRITLQQYDDFELLWLEYRNKLSISKGSALWALQDVQQGLLPCNADLLKARAEGFTALGMHSKAKIDALRILNTSRSILAYDAGHLEASIGRLLQLLPGISPTQLILDTAADLDLPPEVLALQYQELDMLFTASLGSHISAAPFHHLLQRLRSRSSSSSGVQQEVAGDAATSFSAFQQVLQTSANVSLQLQSLAAYLGPELAHTAVQAAPQLLDVPAEQLQASLQWLQQQLRLSPVAAMLLAGGFGELLLLPAGQLQHNYVNSRYLLSQLLGWQVQQVRTMVCNSPQLLVADSQQCALNWQKVQRLARRRLAWLKELSAAGARLVTLVLCAQQVQLVKLQYAADTGDLAGYGIGQVLEMEYADFVAACPGFRTWRAMAPGRWTYFRASGSGGRGDAANSGSIVDAAGKAGGSGGGGAADSRSAAAGVDMQHQVLAVDKSGRPLLVAVGELGPFDRLA